METQDQLTFDLLRSTWGIWRDLNRDRVDDNPIDFDDIKETFDTLSMKLTQLCNPIKPRNKPEDNPQKYTIVHREGREDIEQIDPEHNSQDTPVYTFQDLLDKIIGGVEDDLNELGLEELLDSEKWEHRLTLNSAQKQGWNYAANQVKEALQQSIRAR